MVTRGRPERWHSGRHFGCYRHTVKMEVCLSFGSVFFAFVFLLLFTFCFCYSCYTIHLMKIHIYIESYSYISRYCYANLEYLCHDLPSSTRSNQICQRQYHSPKLISHRSSQELSWSWDRAQWHPRYLRRGYGWRFLSRTWHPRWTNPCALTDRRVRRTRISSNYEGYQRSIWRTLWMI